MFENFEALSAKFLEAEKQKENNIKLTGIGFIPNLFQNENNIQEVDVNIDSQADVVTDRNNESYMKTSNGIQTTVCSTPEGIQSLLEGESNIMAKVVLLASIAFWVQDTFERNGTPLNCLTDSQELENNFISVQKDLCTDEDINNIFDTIKNDSTYKNNEFIHRLVLKISHSDVNTKLVIGYDFVN